jgi:predicted aspartyl protease
MGIIYADILLTNVTDRILAERGHLPASAVRSETVRALVDTGATSLTISTDLASRLGLDVAGTRMASLANGEVVDCHLMGPVEVGFAGRTSLGTALALPGDTQVLLGAIQMEDMDLIPDPRAQALIVNPESPDRARFLAVGVQRHFDRQIS